MRRIWPHTRCMAGIPIVSFLAYAAAPALAVLLGLFAEDVLGFSPMRVCTVAVAFAVLIGLAVASVGRNQAE
jgi:hypothetical protein